MDGVGTRFVTLQPEAQRAPDVPMVTGCTLPARMWVLMLSTNAADFRHARFRPGRDTEGGRHRPLHRAAVVGGNCRPSTCVYVAVTGILGGVMVGHPLP